MVLSETPYWEARIAYFSPDLTFSKISFLTSEEIFVNSLTPSKQNILCVYFKGYRSKKSNKKDFDSYINRNNPSLVFFNGHGSDKLIAGYNDEPLVTAGKDESLLKDKIVYSRTCSSAAILGPASVKGGCKTFIGYIRPFFLPRSKTPIRNTLKDKVAKRFLEPTNL